MSSHATRLATLFALAAATAPALAGHAPPPPPAPSTYCGSGAINCPDAPYAGAVTATGAQVWVRLTAPATVTVHYKPASATGWTKLPAVTTAAASDNTAKFALAGLASARTYAYQVGITQADGTVTWSPSSFFQTQAANPATVSFSVLSDFANALVTSPALRTATAAQNDFVLVIGDMDHRNPANSNGQTLPPGDPAVLADMRAMHQNMRSKDYPIGADFYNGLLASTATHPQTPFYYAWDDHDYCANNVGADCLFRDFAFQAYRENTLWAADSGLKDGNPCESVYQHIPLGTLADLFMLDARSGRVQDGANPTMLGACQLNWLITSLQASTATWKFIMSPVPFNATTKTYDAWGAFPAERAQILSAIAAAGLKNVIVLSGDIHSGGAYDDGTRSGLPEFSVPHANMPATWVNTYCQPIYVNKKYNHLNDEPGTWTIGSLVAPNTSPVPTCLGTDRPAGSPVTLNAVAPFPLDGVNAAGYVRVQLTTTSATVSVMGYDGTVRSGFRADGSSAPLTMTFTPAP